MNARTYSPLALIGFTLFLAALSPLAAGAAWGADAVSPCTDEDRGYAAAMGLGAADDAYTFGVEIQDAVAARDVNALFDLVAGELRNGPRRAFAAGKSFDEIFSDEWRGQILAAKPDCQPVGWRGYMLGSGLIWFANLDGKWSIFSMNGAATEPVTGGAWIFRDALLTRACFTTPWLSTDNYEEYRDRFDVGADFDSAPGQYLGAAVPLEPILASWGDELSLAVELSRCTANSSSDPVVSNDGWVRMTETTEDCAAADADPSTVCPRYRVVRTVPDDRCATLAPNLVCRSVQLLEIVEPTGGTMGDAVSIGIFGLVENPADGELYVAPLVNFATLNEALNYVDALGP